ncbi:hypothetical protein ACF061_37395 [Streptomyces sp. NPDC015220]|uniref:hypothetical protein n=1 Tax=Streptomyces sp. NPDC015220 TaxID=3364947 RepID=UPI0036FCC0E9
MSLFVRQSMSAVGSSADNAAAESWNATMKRETLQNRKSWSSERDASNSSVGCTATTPSAATAAWDTAAPSTNTHSTEHQLR